MSIYASWIIYISQIIGINNMKKLLITFVLINFNLIIGQIKGVSPMDGNIPISTKWILDAAGEIGRSAVKSIYMIYCPKTNSKGTGFLINSGYIVTNEHVVRNCTYNEIFAISSFGSKIKFKNQIIDINRDLVALTPKNSLKGGLELGNDDSLLVGTSVSTWGHPLGYNGPAPILSVGYLSGFTAHAGRIDKKKIRKHIIVNGAFNPGNSGGPLFESNSNKVVGIVVSKHAPMTEFQKSALEVLSKQKSGMQYTATDDKGNKQKFSEAQLVADLLNYFRELSQVMIGEAISVSELKEFLSENKVKY